MIHPLPLHECAVYQHATGTLNIVAALDGNPSDLASGSAGLKLAAAGSVLPDSNALQSLGAIVTDAGSESDSAGGPAAFGSPPSPARSGVRRWLSIMASVYGSCCVLSCVVLVLLLRHDNRAFNGVG